MRFLFAARYLLYILMPVFLLFISSPVFAVEFKAKEPTSYKPSDFTQKELDLSGMADD